MIVAIISTATYKTLAGISGTSEDSKLDLMTDYVDAAIKKWLGRDIEQTTYPGAATGGTGDSGFYSGTGTSRLILRQRPVRSITSIYVDASGRWGQNPDGSFATATLLTAGTDYALDLDAYNGSANVSMKGIVVRIGNVWPALRTYNRGWITPGVEPQRGNIKVAYVAGYSSVPSDIVQAAALWVSHIRNIQPKGGTLSSESLGSYSYSLAAMTGGMPAEVRMLLSGYRELRV